MSRTDFTDVFHFPEPQGGHSPKVVFRDVMLERTVLHSLRDHNALTSKWKARPNAVLPRFSDTRLNCFARVAWSGWKYKSCSHSSGAWASLYKSGDAARRHK